MNKTNQTAQNTPEKIVELVDKFERNVQDFKSIKYNETLIRVEFVNPLFKALGWDVENKAGKTLAYRDVIHEDEVKVSGVTKAPDYSFRAGGVRKFFVETKKPSISLKDDPAPAFQLRRYGYSARLPISILTDFEEFIIYDCSVKPSLNDKSAVGRIKYYTFRDYKEKWDEISALFHRDAVQAGSIDKYVKETKGIRGTTQIDHDFLSDLDSWRLELAKNFALRNPRLTAQQLNYAVQMTIDRIIFLRMCEDRGIELYGQLLALVNGANVYSRLVEVYSRADEKYNSGLFHFSRHKGDASEPDDLTPSLSLDDKVLKDIIRKQYYPECPYEFSMLPVEVLGNAYEQFLGKTISLTDKHQARIEEKPEVRKAGGVYYTPQYVVSYIVSQTVGKLVDNKDAAEVSDIKILDPACGSGSFLLGAYQYLLDWHLNWYKNEMDRIKKIPLMPPAKGKRKKKSDPAAIFQGQQGDWFLSTAEKKRILLNNIYGVDIDQQAVEVTKLSLLLKVLENENKDTLSRQLTLWRERALPDLADNIKCGNSLIGPDIYNSAQMELWNDTERMRVNAFDWDKEFSEIMSSGGFDAVIGNPPWGSLITESEKVYLSRNFVNRRGEAESHLFFIERSHWLLNDTGILGFITPNTWLTVLNSKEIREYLLKNSVFYEICELSKYIFTDAPDIVPILLFLGKKATGTDHCVVKRANVIKVDAGNFESVFSNEEVDQSTWLSSRGSTINLRATGSNVQIIRKCQKAGIALEQLCEVLYGIKTGDNEKYLSKTRSEKHKVKALKTGELGRYRIVWKGLFLWWNEKLAGYRTSSVEVPKIIVQYIRKISLQRRLIAAFDETGCYYPLNNYSYIVSKVPGYALAYVLGIFNSSLINFYFANTFVDYNIKPTYLKQLPIRAINFSNKFEKEAYGRMVQLVNQMLASHRKLAVVKTDHEKVALQRQIDSTDTEIDRLVYQLYGLTEEEIKIVESSAK